MTEPRPTDTGIGVGMGGSCPECRSPVDLGQEFCLECGAAIRIKPEKPKRRAASPSNLQTASMLPPRKKGFPWVPFLLILGLVTFGVVYMAVVGPSANKKHKKPKTNKAGISTLSTAQTTPSAITVPGCNEPGASTMPVDTNSSSNPLSTEQGSTDAFPNTTTQSTEAIPELNSSDPNDPNPDTQSTGITSPSTTPSTGTSTQVTVDENGNICAPRTSATTETTAPSTLTDPVTETGISTGNGTGTASLSQTWPSGTNGYTVVLFSLAKSDYERTDANERSAQAQANGVASGVIDSDDFTSLCPSLWIVFHGTYESQAAAEAERTKIASGTSTYQGAFVRQISTTAAAPSCST